MAVWWTPLLVLMATVPYTMGGETLTTRSLNTAVSRILQDLPNKTGAVAWRLVTDTALVLRVKHLIVLAPFGLEFTNVIAALWSRGITTEVFLAPSYTAPAAHVLYTTAIDKTFTRYTSGNFWSSVDWTFLYGRSVPRNQMAVLVLGSADWVLAAAKQLLFKAVIGAWDTLLLAPAKGIVSARDLCPSIPLAVRVAVLEMPHIEDGSGKCEGLVREAQLKEAGKYVLRSMGCWRDGQLSLKASLFPRLTSFKGATLKTLSVKGFKEVEVVRKGDTIVLEGMLGDMLDKFIKKLNFKFELVEVGGRIDKMANGTFGGALGTMQRREVDIFMGSLAMLLLRTEVVDYSVWWWMFNTPFFTKVPKIREDQFLLFQIFTWKTWCVIAGFLVFCSVMQVLLWRGRFGKVRDRSGRSTTATVHTAVSTVLKTAVYMGSVKQPVNAPERLVLISTWLVVIVMVAVYSGNLIAFLSIPRIEKVPQTIRELIDMGYVFSISYGFSQYHTLKTSPISDHQYLFHRSVFRQDKDLLPVADHVQMTYTHPVALIVTGTASLVLQNTLAKREGSVNICSLQRSTETLSVSPTALSFPKNSPLKPYIDNLLVWMRSSHLINFGSTNCVLANLRSKEAEPLGMVKMGGVMVLWAVGVSLSCLIFIAEKLFSTLK